MRNRRIIVILLTVIVGVGVGFACLVRRGLNQVAQLEPGMITLHLPAGGNAYVRRQSLSGKPAVVYLSESADYCAPYDPSRDFKLPDVVHGGSESPLLVSYQGSVVILHGPMQLQRPGHGPPSSFNVVYEELKPERYSAYVGSNQQSLKLPEGWARIEIPFGHNTCAL
jgi:hypothetical protein